MQALRHTGVKGHANTRRTRFPQGSMKEGGFRAWTRITAALGLGLTGFKVALLEKARKSKTSALGGPPNQSGRLVQGGVSKEKRSRRLNSTQNGVTPENRRCRGGDPSETILSFVSEPEGGGGRESRGKSSVKSKAWGGQKGISQIGGGAKQRYAGGGYCRGGRMASNGGL